MRTAHSRQSVQFAPLLRAYLQNDESICVTILFQSFDSFISSSLYILIPLSYLRSFCLSIIKTLRQNQKEEPKKVPLNLFQMQIVLLPQCFINKNGSCVGQV